MSMRKFALAILVLLGSGLDTPHVRAASSGTCGVTAVSSGPAIVTYNPFSPAGISQVDTSLTLTRLTFGGGAKTQAVDFYIFQLNGANPNNQLVYNGSNVLVTAPNTNLLSLPTPPATGTVYYNFGGVSQPDSVTIPLTITLAPGQNFTASSDLFFSIVYICTGTGGAVNRNVPTTLNDTIDLKINVISAMQASYAGPALDFGEIGMVATGGSAVAGHFNVQSSGPYSVALSSQNGYLMTYPSGPMALGAGNIRYQLSLLGQNPDNASQTFATVTCPAAGVGTSHPIAIVATLQEGGLGKVPAPNYQDFLTVTFTPAAASTTPSQASCN